MFSPAGTRRCRPGRFRFIPPHMCCQAYIPDCHLVRTAIPCLPSYDSLGDFHSRENRSLSLFCKHGFQKRCRHPLWPQRTAAWSSFPTCSLKAGYAARSNTILCTALQVLFLARTRAGLARGSVRRRTIPGLHGKRVVCSMPLERARNP